MSDCAMYQRDRRAARRLAGLCSYCDDAAELGRRSCSLHLRINREAAARYYLRRGRRAKPGRPRRQVHPDILP